MIFNELPLSAQNAIKAATHNSNESRYTWGAGIMDNDFYMIGLCERTHCFANAAAYDWFAAMKYEKLLSKEIEEDMFPYLMAGETY